MPPRLPHGLKKSPFHLSISEKLVFGALSLSTGSGLYLLATSPWIEDKPSDKSKQIQKLESKEKSAGLFEENTTVSFDRK